MNIDLDKRKIRDALRFALQSAAAAAATFIAMEAAGLPEKFVAIISAVLVVQPSVGGTAGKAKDRLVSTVFGSAIGILCLVVLPRGFGTAAALAISMFVMNAVAAFRPDWRYGVVAAVALSLGSVENTTDTAIDRGIAIGLGVVIGMIASFIIWPDSAASRARRHARAALVDIGERLDVLLSHIFGEFDEEKQKKAQRELHDHVKDARSALSSVTGDQKSAVDEYMDVIEHLNDSVLLIDRALSNADGIDSVASNSRDSLESFRDNALTVIKGLAGEDVDVNKAISELEDVLEHGESSDSKPLFEDISRREGAVLDFGICEVVEDLKSLIEISKKVHDGANGTQKLAYMAQEMTSSS